MIWDSWKVSNWGFGLFDLNIIIVFWKGLSSYQDDNYGCNTRGTIFTVVRSTHQGIVRIVLQFSLSFLFFYLNVDFVVMIGTENVVNIFLQICQKGCKINIFAFFEVYRPPCSRICHANITTQHICKRQKETAIKQPKNSIFICHYEFQMFTMLEIKKKSKMIIAFSHLSSPSFSRTTTSRWLGNTSLSWNTATKKCNKKINK